MGDVEAGERFFAQHWAEATAVADPELEFYRAFGLERGSLGQLFGPRVVLRGIGSFLRGHWIGKPVGDPLVMSGTFFARDGELVWSHDPRDASEQPDFAALPGLVGA